MNLEFKYVKEVERDGVNYRLERADVTTDQFFWRTWRSPAAENLKALIYLNNESGRWFAYRLKNPLPTGELYAPFEISYQIKDLSRLLPYQPVAVSHLVQSIIDNGAAADGSDTGLGKTYQALAACRELALKPAIICKKAGVASWRKAAAYLNISPYFIVNWEAIRTGKIAVEGRRVIIRKKREFKAGYDYLWNVPRGIILIFDEAHSAFNPDSQNYAVWTAAAGRASLSLSATFADRPARLQGLFRVLNIMDESEFKEWLLERGHFENQYNEPEALSSVEDMKAIHRVLYPKYGYRVAYDDPDVKAFFPERIIQTEIVDIGTKLTHEQNEAYKEMLSKAATLKELGKQAELLVADLRYRQHAELLKVRVLTELATDYLEQGFAVVIFVNFRETLRYLSESLDTKSLIFGDQERYKLPREQVVDDFQSGKNRIILCMADAGGQSISLHDINGYNRRMSLICPTYNPITLQQVLGRTLRAGSKSTPIMKLVYAAGTIEEKVAETVNRKLDNIAALNDGDLMEHDLFNLGV